MANQYIQPPSEYHSRKPMAPSEYQARQSMGNQSRRSMNGPMGGNNDMAEFMAKYTNLVGSFINSFVLKAVVDLGIPDILNKAGGQLTLDEIAEQLPSETVELGYLDRIMTFAALLGIFKEVSPKGAKHGQKKFCLTPMSSIILSKDGAPNSFVNLTNVLLSDVSVESFMTLSQAVLTGSSPFKLAHGVGVWEYGKTHPEWDRLFNQTMESRSNSVVRPLVQSYRGFDDVKVLVDVGGGTGTLVTTIIKAHPGIKAINFDQPHVIAAAPKAPGVTQVGGDMFEKVPEGDAILLKYVLHDWNDHECVEILKNCHKSLADGGKLIIVERVLSEPRVLDQSILDMVMLAQTTSGRERTASEWSDILEESGFSFQVVPIPGPSGLSVIEGYKS